MKIGIITDIHSNIKALNAVLDEFDKIKVDRIIDNTNIEADVVAKMIKDKFYL